MSNWSFVYIIYSVDALTQYPAFIDAMSPAEHVRNDAIAEAFVQTEGDEQYDYGYLADESGDESFLPYAERESEDAPNAGMHRKWVGELTRDQWRMFADTYCIDLDDDDLPIDYTETLGSITEHGHIPAVAVSNVEGWDSPRGSVIDSNMYLSFG